MNRGTAFITGASSGFGAAYARFLAEDGYNLVLHGRREQLLSGLCRELSERYKIRADFVLAELTQEEGIHTLEERLKLVKDLSMLINNAGTSTTGPFADETMESQEGLIRLHVLAAVRLTHAAIPLLKRRGGGAVINVSSVAGFLFGPGSVTYCAVKNFLLMFSEALHLELSGSGIRVQAFCPGYAITDFHRRLGIDTSQAKFPGFATAESVVRKSLRALEKGRVVVIPGLIYRLAIAASRVIPRRLFYYFSLNYSRRNALRRQSQKLRAPAD
jgi:short-subunit dehydrogenase